MSNPYQEGFEACLLWLEGKRTRCNPHQYGESAYDWDMGWSDAADAVVETARSRFSFRNPDETIPQLVRKRYPVCATP